MDYLKIQITLRRKSRKGTQFFILNHSKSQKNPSHFYPQIVGAPAAQGNAKKVISLGGGGEVLLDSEGLSSIHQKLVQKMGLGANQQDFISSAFRERRLERMKRLGTQRPMKRPNRSPWGRSSREPTNQAAMDVTIAINPA